MARITAIYLKYIGIYVSEIYGGDTHIFKIRSILFDLESTVIPGIYL